MEISSPTPEDVFKFIRSGKVPIPISEENSFKVNFKNNYNPSCENCDLVYSAWKSALQTVSEDSLEYVMIDRFFQEKIIDSGIAKKIREGIPLKDLIIN